MHAYCLRLLNSELFIKLYQSESSIIFRLTVGSSFDLNLSIRFEFSISTSQSDSKFDSDRIVKRSKPESSRIGSDNSIRSVKNSIF